MDSRVKQVKEFCVGILIGIASMLPGISGAVIAVCFGVYERLVRDVAEVRTRLRSDFWFIAIMALGLLVGVIISAKFLTELMDAYRVAALFLFVGLIAGQVPTVYYMTKPKENGPMTRANWTALICGLLIMGGMAVVSLYSGGGDYPLTHDTLSVVIMFFVGIICAVSAIAPGISHSTVLVAMGMLAPFYAAIAHADLILVLPMVAGFILGALWFAKIMNRCFQEHERSTTFAILGLTLGSLITLTATTCWAITSVGEALGGIVTCAIGVAISLWFMRLGLKYQLNE